MKNGERGLRKVFLLWASIHICSKDIKEILFHEERVPNGESFLDIKERAEGILQMIKEEASSSIAIVGGRFFFFFFFQLFMISVDPYFLVLEPEHEFEMMIIIGLIIITIRNTK